MYTQGPKFAIDAIAAGKEGAISIHRFCAAAQQPYHRKETGRQFIELDKENIKLDAYDNSSRQIPGIDENH